MKTVRIIVALLVLAGPAAAGLTPFAHTTTLGTGDMLVTGDFAHDLDMPDSDLVGLRIAFSPADNFNVIGELYAPNSFEEIGFACSVMGYLEAGDLPFKLQLRAGIDLPFAEGEPGVLFDVALVDTYQFSSLDGLSIYAAWGTVAFVEIRDENSWIEARFAAGIRYLFQDQGVAIFVELEELVDTYAMFGMSVYL